MKTKEITKAPCRTCLRETKHKVLASRQISDSEEIEGVGEVSWEDDYEMLECCGCQTVVLRHTAYWSEDPETTVSYHPPPVSRAFPTWKSKLPLRFRSLVDEVYAALHADSRRLALMGARTLVDMLMLDKIGDVGSFQHKLEQLEKRGLVGRQNRDFLAVALDAGNAAAHRGYQPKKEQINHAMDIVENLLQAVYVLEGSAEELKKTTPPRPTKKKKSKVP
jgi:hypothetical protein